MMDKSVKLKDGTDVVIRSLRADDLERSLAFFRALPDEDRTYLRLDVTKEETIRRRIRTMELGTVKRLVAVSDDEIVAEGALELRGHGWEEHIGEMRLIVGQSFQRKGLGALMARELYFLAISEKLEEIVVQVMQPQVAAIGIFKRLGFSEDATLHDFVKDMGGVKQDLVVLRCNLKRMWDELGDYLSETDWQRTR